MPEDQDDLLRALHDAHAPALLRYVTRLTYDPALAQDVVQEALLRAWKRPAILEQGDSASRAWLFTVARNLVIDDRRSARHRHEVTSDWMPETSRTDGTDAALDRWLVSDALRSLSDVHRHAVVNAYYLGKSAVEIAREDGVPVGTVRSRMHYALRALRLAMQERGVTR